MVALVFTLLVILLHETAFAAEQPSSINIMCPSKTLETGEVIQLVLKKAVTSGIPSVFNVPSELSTWYHCSIPACLSNPCQHGGTCEETDEGFNCTCLNGYRGDRCEYVGGDLFEIMSLDNNSETVTVRCPVDVTSIADCWYEERAAMNPREESIAVVCCTVKLCSTPRGSPVGLESGKVPNSAITISSKKSNNLSELKARLNSNSAWVSAMDDEDPWLQIKFNSIFVITAIMTQGRANAEQQRVTSYTISSSMDGSSWTHNQDINTNTVKVYTGNYDSNSVVVHNIFKPIECLFFRIHPKTANNDHRALRLELTGYGPLNDLLAAMNREEVSCSRPIQGEGMGVEDGRIPDSSLTSSSDYHLNYNASDGRLNGGVTLHEKAAWLARDDDIDKWVKILYLLLSLTSINALTSQIDLGRTSNVTGVIVQGRFELAQWITSVKVSYSLDNVTWTYALEPQCGEQRIYAANYDNTTPETILFPRPITARYVRIHPLTWIGHQAMRYEVVGIADQTEL
ncbi:lactadherin-like [Strongylocentrotus purpuratus]|uniref:EGF-like repeat and discoidin I-like domain-containing protein 3 n=1 Tax=Strongylocentrotus purpuratus TaxID=7668 RepID=A0A7M7NU67_STRPU|nr:lactadherin-like [Strongylocentrotus purpuratus]